METKVWDNSYTKDDVEALLGRPLSEGEWNIIADELYNNEELYDLITGKVIEIAKAAIE
jgi:hypothetical protein